MNMGLLGAIGGLGQGMATVGANMIKQQDDMDREQRSLVISQALRQQAEDMETAKRSRISSEINAEANSQASARGEGGLLAARKAYADAGMSDNPEVAKALDDAQSRESAPNTRDYVQASVKLGHTSPIDLLKVDSSERQIKASETQATNQSRALDLREEQNRQRQIEAEMRERYNYAKLDQQGQIAMERISKAVARDGGDKLPSEAKMIEYLVEQKIVPDKKAAAEWVKQGKAAPSSYSETSKPDGFGGMAVTQTTKGPGKPPSSAAQFSSLPDGAKQIGTKDGRPVYQLPNGKKIIQE